MFSSYTCLLCAWCCRSDFFDIMLLQTCPMTYLILLVCLCLITHTITRYQQKRLVFFVSFNEYWKGTPFRWWCTWILQFPYLSSFYIKSNIDKTRKLTGLVCEWCVVRWSHASFCGTVRGSDRAGGSLLVPELPDVALVLVALLLDHVAAGHLWSIVPGNRPNEDKPRSASVAPAAGGCRHEEEQVAATSCYTSIQQVNNLCGDSHGSVSHPRRDVAHVHSDGPFLYFLKELWNGSVHGNVVAMWPLHAPLPGRWRWRRDARKREVRATPGRACATKDDRLPPTPVTGHSAVS